MRLFHNLTGNSRRLPAALAAGVCAVALVGWQARAALPRWMQDAVGAGAIEAALYRAMELPGLTALYPRPPKEAQEQLTALIGKSANQAELYSLRAMEEEQALDFKAAEADWKSYAAHASDLIGAKVELADYYHRQMEAAHEVEELMQVGSAEASPGETYIDATEQRSWRAFERVLTVTADQGMAEDVTAAAYTAWIARYPAQSSLYAREFTWLLEKKKYADAEKRIAQYRKAFPKDEVFPVKAAALLQYRQGSVKEALQVYDTGFTPLWPAELVESYYALLSQTHQLRAFVAEARARLAHNPDDLNALARLFYAAQQQGNLASAQQVIDAFRMSKESRKAAWSAEELHTLAVLTEAIHAYPEAARYNFALYHAEGPLQAEGLSGLVRILLAAPDQPVELGANNLSMYRDIATLDRGPGYWNGVLSLWLNSTYPESAYQEEERRAQPYFHRTKAAELLALLDKTYPQVPQRAELHKLMIQAYGGYGETALVIKAGGEYLNSFPAVAGDQESEEDRVLVAMLMADAYARQRDTTSEFALYDRLLAELSVPSAGMPLTAAAASNRGVTTTAVANDAGQTPATNHAAHATSAFELNASQASGVFVAGAREYQTLLERYLGRLTATGQLPQALAVLRRELDRNPNDPLLYERLASFLEQNNLSAQQEAVYQQAIQKFQEKGWYDKLARLYLREKKREAFAELTRKVTDIFHGSELEEYFQQVTQGGPQLFLQLNLYAHQRFPHDQVFITNLLAAYQAKTTRDDAAWEKLLREHWADSAELRGQFFDSLSRTGKLDAELSRLHELVPAEQQQKANPAAARELAEIEMWQSHFEMSTPLMGALAEAYPADEEVGTQASSLFRSLAYFDATHTEQAVAVEKRLLAANPANSDRLARIGDIYSDSGVEIAGHENLAAAAPYWRRMVALHPGSPDGYLQAATVFWDYFEFDQALQLIHEARTKFAQPHLYGYEAGAIDEGKRDVAAAVREYVAAAADANASTAAASRLMQLARRASSAKLVDEETARVAADGEIGAIQLRLRVLKVQKRESKIAPLLDAALSKASTFEQAQAIASQAQAYSLTPLYERALTRQIALVTDPVQKIELTYTLAQSLEGRKRVDEAARVMDAVYRDNTKLLGVVRATTDFYWRNKQSEKAIATLVQAAKDATAAQPSLAHQFVVEAASKANEAGNYAEARTLMKPLLDVPADAYNAEYLAVVADSYARPGDNAGLKQLYLTKLAALRDAKGAMTADERRQKTALLRRGLIPALTRLKDYAGAIDQYIALLSAYPEDTGAIDEASLYALRYGRQAQLVAFVSDTVKASPRDSRFALMLGQMQTTFENYPAAIDAYAHAITIRADRSDIFSAKADLEERLQRFDEACQDYEQLYRLSYRNPEWMVKIATVRARQGRRQDAVAALERAWATPAAGSSTPTAASYFRIAGQLETWAMLAEAIHFAELGVKAEGDDLLAGSSVGNQNGDDPQGAVLYARLLTRARQQEKALAVLDAASKAADISANAPSIVMQQVEKQGLASVTDADWRKQRVEQRRQTAALRYRSALLAIGEAVGTYFTPEEKQRFVALLDARWAGAAKAPWSERAQWIDVAHAAGVLDIEARYRKQILLDRVYEAGAPSDAQYAPYVALQRSRFEFAELAQTLEAYALLRKPEEPAGPRVAAVEAWRNAGDEVAEMRALRRISFAGNRNAGLRERYLQLLLKHDPAGFQAFGASSKKGAVELAAANYAVAHGDGKAALGVVNAHAASFDAVWKSAYTALLGLYFRDTSATTDTAFHSALADDATIGQRVDTKEKIDRAQQLAGGVWFSYGMRYGVYRTLAPESEWQQHDPEDLLAAGLERNPASVTNYITLAHAYADAGKSALALVEYGHALEIAPDSPAVHDAMAELLWQSDKMAAIEHWRAGLVSLNRIQDRGPAPESFWSGFALIARHLGARKLTEQLHPEMDALLRTYLARNGNYRSSELLEAAFKAAATQEEGVRWMLSLSTASSYPASVLVDLDTVQWIAEANREPILLRELELARIAAARDAEGENGSQSYREQQLVSALRTLATYYLRLKMDGKAEALLQQMTVEQRKDAEMVTVLIQLAGHTHTLKPLLAGWSDGDDAPNSALLRNVAGSFAADEQYADALALWEFVFEREQVNHDLLASDYLGLADARLQVGNVAGAVETLRRMTRLPGDPYANVELAAALLEKRGRSAEAVEFLATLVKGVPWEASYRLRLGLAQMRGGKDGAQAAAGLGSIAGSGDAPYALRVQAALGMRGGKAGGAAAAGAAELQLIASGRITAQQAKQPYFVAARLLAAESLTSAAERATLLRQAISIRPEGLRFVTAVGNDAQGMTAAMNLPLQLFRAEAEAGHSATALVALEAMRNSSYQIYDTQATDAESEGAEDVVSADAPSAEAEDETADDAAHEGHETLAELERQAPLPAHGLKDTEKLALGLQIAQVYKQTDAAASALPYLKLAARLETRAAAQSELLHRVAGIQTTLKLEERNASRRPTIQKALDQSNLVRPRMSAADLSREQMREVAQ